MKPDPLSFLAALRQAFPMAVRDGLYGRCFQVHLLLRVVWPEATAWYDQDHVITEIRGRFYDIRGEVFPERHQPMTPKEFNEAYLWHGQKKPP